MGGARSRWMPDKETPLGLRWKTRFSVLDWKLKIYNNVKHENMCFEHPRIYIYAGLHYTTLLMALKTLPFPKAVAQCDTQSLNVMILTSGAY